MVGSRSKSSAVSTSPTSTSTSPIADATRSHWSIEEEADTASPLANIGRRVTKTSASAYSSIRSVSGSTFNSRSDAGHSHARAVAASVRKQRPIPAPDPIITISTAATPDADASLTSDSAHDSSFNSALPDDNDDNDYVTVEHPAHSESNQVVPRDKASRVLGIKHRRSMEPIPASNRASIASVRSVPTPGATPTSHSGPTLPLASLYVVSGLPKSPHTWTLADPDSVLGLHHTEGAVSRWWRPEVLGSTVSPGAGGGKKKRKGKTDDTSTVFSSSGHLSKQEVGKMLSKALKVRAHRTYVLC